MKLTNRIENEQNVNKHKIRLLEELNDLYYKLDTLYDELKEKKIDRLDVDTLANVAGKQIKSVALHMDWIRLQVETKGLLEDVELLRAPRPLELIDESESKNKNANRTRAKVNSVSA